MCIKCGKLVNCDRKGKSNRAKDTDAVKNILYCVKDILRQMCDMYPEHSWTYQEANALIVKAVAVINKGVENE